MYRYKVVELQMLWLLWLAAGLGRVPGFHCETLVGCGENHLMLNFTSGQGQAKGALGS